MPFLQLANISSNKIKKLPRIEAPKLRKLNLNDNKIDDLSEFKGHHTIELLELRKNRLKSLDGLKDMSSLIELYLAENRLTSFEGLKAMPILKKLHLRSNNIKKLPEILPELPKLYHLNLRENKLSNLKDIVRLSKYSGLLSLTVIANSMLEEIGDVSFLLKENKILFNFCLKNLV